MKNKDRLYGDMEDKLSDASEYGEFISTYHYWVSSEEQKNRAEHLQQLGKTEQR